ncbi:MAG TPA: hypothetical protein VGE63_00870 [Candidatus Paceibacterota bacterium]
MRYVIYAILVVCGLFSVVHASEALVITEIMYDAKDADTDKEWIEVVTESLTAPLASIRLQVGDKKHTLKSNTSGDTLPSGAVCIIAQSETNFKLLFPNFSGCIFESGFSLTNQSGSIKIVHGTSGEVYGAAEYTSAMGAAGDGNSLTLGGSGFAGKTPTPGVDSRGGGDQAPANPDNTSQPTQPTTPSNSGVAEAVQMSNPQTDYKITITSPKSLFEYETLHIPLTVTFKSGREVLEIKSGTLYISYGDGSFDVINDGNFALKHTYEHASNVTIKLYYYSSPLASLADAEATVKLEVKQFPLNILYGDKRELVITNSDSIDYSLTGFTVQTDTTHVYEFPFGMVVAGKGSIVIPYELHGLRGANIVLYDKRHKKIVTTASLNPTVESLMATQEKVMEAVSPFIETPSADAASQETSGERMIVQETTAPGQKSSNKNVGLYLALFGAGILVSFAIEYTSKLIARKKASPVKDDALMDEPLL